MMALLFVYLMRVEEESGKDLEAARAGSSPRVCVEVLHQKVEVQPRSCFYRRGGGPRPR